MTVGVDPLCAVRWRGRQRQVQDGDARRSLPREQFATMSYLSRRSTFSTVTSMSSTRVERGVAGLSAIIVYRPVSCSSL